MAKIEPRIPALVDLPYPGRNPSGVGPDVIAPPRDALEPVEEPDGFDPLEPDLLAHGLDLAPLDVYRALLQPRPDDLAHQGLALPVGGPIPALSGDHRSPFLVLPGPVCASLPRESVVQNTQPLSSTFKKPSRRAALPSQCLLRSRPYPRSPRRLFSILRYLLFLRPPLSSE